MTKKPKFTIKIALSAVRALSPDAVETARNLITFSNNGICYAYGKQKNIRAIVLSSKSEADILKVFDRKDKFWCHGCRPHNLFPGDKVRVIGHQFGLVATVVSIKKLTEAEAIAAEWPSENFTTSEEYLGMAIDAEDDE